MGSCGHGYHTVRALAMVLLLGGWAHAMPQASAPASPSSNPPGTQQPQGAARQPAGQALSPSSAAAQGNNQPSQGQQNRQPPPSGQQNPPPQPGQIQLEAPPVAPTEEKPKPAAPAEGNANIIKEIQFRGNRRIPSSTLRARIFSHAGDAYDENALERDFHALWNTGFFDDLRIEVTDTPEGKIVVFRVQEKKLIRTIEYKGLSTVSTSDVLDRFKERKVGLSIESQYDPVVVKRAEVVIEEMLAEHGRQFATVRARTRNIPPNSVALTFIVVEGPKVKIGSIRFTGNNVFSGRTLVRQMKYSKPLGAPPFFYLFHQTYDKDKVDYDLEKIREFYQNHGYFFALPKEPQVKMVDTQRSPLLFFLGRGRGKRVDLTIPIEEGDQYRLGRFVIRGNKLFKEEFLKRFMPMKPGDVFDRSKVTKSIETYTKLYGQFGYINFTATPDIEPDRRRHVVNLALDFEEDKQFFVHRIEFSGNTKTRDKVIRRELLVDEGNVFNTNYWDLSILRINQLGFFDPIKKEDYDIKQNTKDRTVDITVKVKEKGKNSIGFSGGVSGLAGNFVGLNYATNNFLGLGETLSIQAEFGTFEKLYSFGFTEPYLLDRPITTGFTVFKSNYHFDQLRTTLAAAGVTEAALQQTEQSLFGQTFFQNFQQNQSGFTVFAQYPLRRTFARVGLTYGYTVSSVIPFSQASQAYFNALAFRQFAGPNQLSGITQSQITPTILYNTTDSDLSPTRGRYLSASLGVSGGILGGNVNTIQPMIEAKYFHPVNHHRNVLAFHFRAATITGFGGRVPPPYARFYMGGEYDIRGFDIYTISPVGFFPVIGSVCNRDANGNIIPLIGGNGKPVAGACGSSTSFPYNAVQFVGGDTSLLTNFEYRIPIAGPVTLAYFVDAGSAFILRPGQLRFQPEALSNISTQFPYFPTPNHLQPVGVTNFHPRSSTGFELFVMLPVVHAPFRIYYGYNWLRLNSVITPPQGSALPPVSLFPNVQTYNDALRFFQPLTLKDRRGMVGFTVGRTF
jgi:outer membrane protein insertion porin family